MSILTKIKAKHNIETKIDSSAIDRIRYNRKMRELYIVFQNGRGYIYKDVSPAEVDALLASPSKGRYLVRMIKKDHTCVSV